MAGGPKQFSCAAEAVHFMHLLRMEKDLILLYISVSTRSVIGQFCGPYFTVYYGPLIFKVVPFLRARQQSVAASISSQFVLDWISQIFLMFYKTRETRRITRKPKMFQPAISSRELIVRMKDIHSAQ